MSGQVHSELRVLCHPTSAAARNRSFPSFHYHLSKSPSWILARENLFFSLLRFCPSTLVIELRVCWIMRKGITFSSLSNKRDLERVGVSHLQISSSTKWEDNRWAIVTSTEFMHMLSTLTHMASTALQNLLISSRYHFWLFRHYQFPASEGIVSPSTAQFALILLWLK